MFEKNVDVCNGLRYLHDNNIIHGLLDPMSITKSFDGRYKIWFDPLYLIHNVSGGQYLYSPYYAHPEYKGGMGIGIS